MVLKSQQVWIMVLLAILLITLVTLASGVIPIDGLISRNISETTWLSPAFPGTATATLKASGWWSNPPTPQIMQTWESTSTSTQTKNP